MRKTQEGLEAQLGHDGGEDVAEESEDVADEANDEDDDARDEDLERREDRAECCGKLRLDRSEDRRETGDVLDLGFDCGRERRGTGVGAV